LQLVSQYLMFLICIQGYISNIFSLSFLVQNVKDSIDLPTYKLKETWHHRLWNHGGKGGNCPLTFSMGRASNVACPPLFMPMHK